MWNKSRLWTVLLRSPPPSSTRRTAFEHRPSTPARRDGFVADRARAAVPPGRRRQELRSLEASPGQQVRTVNRTAYGRGLVGAPADAEETVPPLWPSRWCEATAPRVRPPPHRLARAVCSHSGGWRGAGLGDPWRGTGPCVCSPDCPVASVFRPSLERAGKDPLDGDHCAVSSPGGRTHRCRLHGVIM